MKHSLLFMALATFLVADSTFDIDNDFLQSLDEVSAIATKTKLNIDDSPSFVTVLQSQKLQKLGITNVFEALAQVPGVQLKREQSGVPVVAFRGVSQKGEVKLMIDGMTINNSYRGSIYYFLNFPIELVQRIEVIRGAGSVLYGSGAMSGVVNIITKSASNQTQNKLFISGGTYDKYKTGALLSTLLGTTKVTIDTYYQNHNTILDNTDRGLKDYSIGLNLKDKHFGFLARIKNSEEGNAYGVLGVADTNKQKYNNTNQAILTQLSYAHSLGNDNDIEFLAGYSKYTQDIATKHTTLGDLQSIYGENSYYVELNLKSNMLEDNEFLFGARTESAKVLNSTFKQGAIALPPIANPSSKRDILSVYINDKYTISSDLDISAGLRYDHYSDFGNALSPTLSFIYRLSKKLRIKALYTNAFRAPSWIELTSNPNLKAETSKSYELGFIYKEDTTNVLRLNVYTTTIHGMISKNTTYTQNTNGEFKGSELEYSYTPIQALELNLLGSYIEAKNNNNQNIPDVANVLTSASILYEFDSGLTASTLLKYVSSSHRSSSDTRESMPSSTILDSTLTYTYKEFTSSLIIKDIFNSGTNYALPLSTNNNDFYDGGRTIILKAEWEF